MIQILDTIPIYKTPTWPGIVGLIGLGLIIVGMLLLEHTDYAGAIIVVAGVVMLLVCTIFMFVLKDAEYSHDEYIIKLDNISAQEFIERYSVTKRFKYTDIIQVREIGE